MMLVLMLLTVTQAISVIEGEVPGQGGGVPPALNQTSTSCPCNKLLLSSLGPAVQFQPRTLGVYTRSSTNYNKHASYRMNSGADYRLYWLKNGWLIGDKRGAIIGYIHNPDTTQPCPYNIVSGWLFYSSAHGVWYPDTTLVLG